MNDAFNNSNDVDCIKICADMVEKDDHDRYLTTLFVSKEMRRSLNALYAFNIEVAKTLETTKETMIGELKLQWWRDALEAAKQGTIREHPVIIELAPIIINKTISVDGMMHIINARSRELTSSQPSSLKHLIEYCRYTAGALNKLAFQIIADRPSDIALKHVEQIGIAWGLIGIIRAISFHASNSRCSIPVDLMKAANINEQQLYKGSFSPELKDVIRQIADTAEEHLRDNEESMMKMHRNGFLLAPIATSYLHRLKRQDYDIQAVDFSKGAFGRLCGLTWVALTGRL